MPIWCRHSLQSSYSCPSGRAKPLLRVGFVSILSRLFPAYLPTIFCLSSVYLPCLSLIHRLVLSITSKRGLAKERLTVFSETISPPAMGLFERTSKLSQSGKTQNDIFSKKAENICICHKKAVILRSNRKMIFHKSEAV